MPRCAAEHSHGRVELRTERQVRAALPLGQEGGGHLGPRTSRQRGGGVAAAIVAAGRIGRSRLAQLLQLRPAVHQVAQGRETALARGAGRGRRRRRGYAWGPAEGG